MLKSVKKNNMKSETECALDIMKACEDGIKEAVVVYDNIISPPTYGDFLFVAMVARYLVLHNINVTYYIVNSEQRYDWKDLNGDEKVKVVASYKAVADIVLNKPIDEKGYTTINYCGMIIGNTTEYINGDMQNKSFGLTDYIIFAVDNLEMYNKIKGLIDRSNMRDCSWKVKYAKKNKVEVVNWSDIENIVKSGIFIPIRDRVEERAHVYSSCFNILNHLMVRKDKEFLKQFLFSLDEFEGRVKYTKPEVPYVTYHCRYSTAWAPERNNTGGEFVTIVNRLKKIFPNHKIMIVSDDQGCLYFKKIADSNGLDLIYSKDYSPSYFGDGVLILNSDYYFQLRAGGVGVFAYFSAIPCEYYTPMSHENEWSKGKATSWANEKQFINKILQGDNTLYLPTIKGL